MLKKTHKFKLQNKIFIAFLFIIFIPAIISFVLSYSLVKNNIEYEIKLRLNDGISGFYQEIIKNENYCEKTSAFLANDENIKNLIITKDYKTLKQRFIMIYNMSNLDVIELEDTSGKVLLRGHNPAISGDIKLDQSIIKKGLNGEHSLSFEKGKSGLAIRSVSPVKHKNKIIGLIMTGSSLSKTLVNNTKKLTGMDNGIYLSDKKLISTYAGLETLPENYIKQLNQNKKNLYIPNIQLGSKRIFAIILKPIFLKNGKYWGSLTLLLSRFSEGLFLKHSLYLILGIVILGLLIVFIIYILLAKYINKNLSAITNGMKSIGYGNFDNKISVSGNDEFKEIAESFNQMMIKIKEYDMQLKQMQETMVNSAKLTTASQLTVGMAHEIRNPLSSIKMMSQIISDRYFNEKDCKEINTIIKEVNKINGLIKDLLEYGKPGPVNFIKTNINKIINECIASLEYNIRQQDIEIITQFDDTIPKILIDIEKMKIVFDNLILNAVQALPDGGTLVIQTNSAEKKGYINIIFRDSGKSLSAEDTAKIFEPFYTTKKEGIGLGLTLVKTILERHGATIQAEKQTGGTAFIITMPAKAAPYESIINS